MNINIYWLFLIVPCCVSFGVFLGAFFAGVKETGTTIFKTVRHSFDGKHDKHYYYNQSGKWVEL